MATFFKEGIISLYSSWASVGRKLLSLSTNRINDFWSYFNREIGLTREENHIRKEK